MIWRKLGLLFAPPEGLAWAASHAAVPVVELAGPTQRVYFTARDVQGRGHVGAFELLWAGHEPRAGAVTTEPILGPGTLGTFDDSGVTTSSLVRTGKTVLLYYTGWSLGVTVPFYLASGVAISDDDGRSFRRVSEAPILPRIAGDAYLNASPWVLLDGGIYRMWYTAGTGWKLVDGTPKHWYHIRYAESADGLSWKRRGVIAIDYASTDEHALSRPCVVKDGDLYRMWFAARGAAYRLAYAESADGIAWQRKDSEAGLDVSSSGWDGDMLAYPVVFDRLAGRYLLYNGNGFGRTGIGAAVLARE